MENWQGSKEQGENLTNDDGASTSDVETELFIGPPPERRARRLAIPPQNWSLYWVYADAFAYMKHDYEEKVVFRFKTAAQITLAQAMIIDLTVR